MRAIATSATSGISRRSSRSAFRAVRNSVMGSPWRLRARSGSWRLRSSRRRARRRRWETPMWLRRRAPGWQLVRGRCDRARQRAGGAAALFGGVARHRRELDALDRQQAPADLQRAGGRSRGEAAEAVEEVFEVEEAAVEDEREGHLLEARRGGGGRGCGGGARGCSRAAAAAAGDDRGEVHVALVGRLGELDDQRRHFLRGRDGFAEAHDRRVCGRVLRLRGARARQLAFGARELSLCGRDLRRERARLLALGRYDEHPRGAQERDHDHADEDDAIAPGHLAVAPELELRAADAATPLDAATVFVAATVAATK